MAFTVTSRASWSNQTTPAATSTSGSFTPTANSRLFVFAIAQRDAHMEPRDWATPAGFTVLDESTLYNWNGDSGYAANVKGWYIDIGGSPSPMTVALDAFAPVTANVYFYSAAAFDVTGFDTGAAFPQASVDNGAQLTGGNSHSGTLTLGGNPTNGNLVVGMFGSTADAGGGFTTPTGYTALVNQNHGYTQVGIFYRTDTTSPTITSSDLGQTVGSWGGIAFEMALAGGGAAPNAGPLVNANRLKSMLGALVN